MLTTYLFRYTSECTISQSNFQNFLRLRRQGGIDPLTKILRTDITNQHIEQSDAIGGKDSHVAQLCCLVMRGESLWFAVRAESRTIILPDAHKSHPKWRHSMSRLSLTCGIGLLYVTMFLYCAVSRMMPPFHRSCYSTLTAYKTCETSTRQSQILDSSAPVLPLVGHVEYTLFRGVWPLCVDMKLSTKPEVHNVSQCRDGPM